jgi:hypothetical protein
MVCLPLDISIDTYSCCLSTPMSVGQDVLEEESFLFEEFVEVVEEEGLTFFVSALYTRRFSA